MKLGLPCPVLPSRAREEAARRMGVSVDDVVEIALGTRAWRDRKVIDETTFLDAYPDDDFEEFTCARVLPDDLTVREIEVPRDPSELLAPPISSADVVAADVFALAEHLERMLELSAPNILLRHARSIIQAACEDASHGTAWQPLSELMTGRPAEPGAAGDPQPMFAVPFGSESCETVPCDCAFLDSGFLLQFRFASIVLDADGEVRDFFGTCGLRAVGSDERHVLLVCGGGRTANSGYFGAEAFVRDVVSHGWLKGVLPESLPRFVAGTIGDAKWSVVVDVVKGGGYRMAPRWIGDQCGNTFNSTCGHYAWDGTRFVLEANSGTAVLDARDLHGDLVSFAKTSNGWRFVMLEHPSEEEEDEESLPNLRLLDEAGQIVRELGEFDYESAVALSPNGARLLHVTGDRLRMLDTDSGEALGHSIDLRPLRAALALPEDGGLWQRLAAAYAVPAALAEASPAQAREAIKDTWGDEPSDDDLAAAIGVARQRPELPKRLPQLKGSP